MSTVVELDDDIPTEHGYQKRLHTKGASEIVLECCSHFINDLGEKQILDD